MIELDLPDMGTQRDVIRRERVREATTALMKGLDAPHVKGPVSFDYRAYSVNHLLTEAEGWEPPPHEVVNAWFEHFKTALPDFDSDKKLGNLLGLEGNADRRIRSFRNGERPIPYGIWRRFLVMTGRAHQEIWPVLAIIDDDLRV